MLVDKSTQVVYRLGTTLADVSSINKWTLVYTDGACVPNPGVGGWGFVHVSNDTEMFFKMGSEDESTNQRMEITAVIEALNSFDPGAIKVITDSKFVIDICVSWIWNWEAYGWSRSKTRKGKGEIKNLDLIMKLHVALKRHDAVKFKWVKGHSGNKWNDRADEICSLALVEIAGLPQETINKYTSNYKRDFYFSEANRKRKFIKQVDKGLF